MQLLITKETILKYREISKAVRDEKINPFIQDAELLDLRAMLGESMYNDLRAGLLVTDPDVIEEKWELLWNGGEYTHEGTTHYFTGLERVLCYLAYARYMMFGSNTDTGFGLVQKSFQDSTPVPQVTKKTLYTENRRMAGQYFADIEKFLTRNRSDYPNWRKGCGGRTTSFRISKIL